MLALQYRRIPQMYAGFISFITEVERAQ